MKSGNMGDTKYKHGDRVVLEGPNGERLTIIVDENAPKHPTGCGWESCTQRECHNPSDLTENSQKAQNPSNMPNAETRLSSKTSQIEFKMHPLVEHDVLTLLNELREAHLVIREQGEALAALRKETDTLANIVGENEAYWADKALDVEASYQDRLDALRADVDRDKWMEEWTRLAEKYQALLTERDHWKACHAEQTENVRKYIGERDEALAKVKDLEKQVVRLENARDSFAQGYEDFKGQTLTLRATIARVEGLRDRWQGYEGQVSLGHVSIRLTAALKGDGK